MNTEEYIRKWLSGELTPAEKQQFEKTDDFQAIHKLSESLQYFKAPDYNIYDQYDKTIEKISVTKEVSLWQNPRYWFGAAASLLIIMISTLFYIYQDILADQGYSKISTLVLPDSSFVTLNAGSNLVYDQSIWHTNRDAFLEGEAFFTVAEGNRFNVMSSTGVVTVLGTSFNIKDRPGYYEVMCYSGAVEVRCQGRDYRLFPNQMFRYLNGKGEVKSFQTTVLPTWMDGESSFKSVPLEQVVRELERQYNITVDTGDIDIKQVFTGSFTHSDLILALKSITIPLNAAFEIDGDQVKLSSANN